ASLAVLVSGQLLAACPSDASPRTRQMCDAMRERRTALSVVLNMRKRKPGGMRPCLIDLDKAWGSFRRRLEAAASVPGGGELATGEPESLTRVNTAVAGLLRAREERPASNTDAQPTTPATAPTPTASAPAPTNGVTNGATHS